MGKAKRIKSTAVIIAEPQLTEVREYARLAGVSVDQYVIGAALNYPAALIALRKYQKDARQAEEEVQHE